MRVFINRMLAALGLVSVRRYEAVIRHLEQAKAGSREWKTKTAQSMARVKLLEGKLKHRERVVQKMEQRVSKMRQRGEAIDTLRARLGEAQRELVIAREHLMAIEVKLDILEGAANVLDARTRATIVKEPSRTSASV